jgi:hypothetical protein
LLYLVLHRNLLRNLFFTHLAGLQIQARALVLLGHFQGGLLDLPAGFLDMPSEVLEQNFTVP